jgi:hypothetical protein
MKVGFVVAERLLFVPSMGFCLFLGLLLDHYLNDDTQQPDQTSPPAPQSTPTPPTSKKSRSTTVVIVVIVLSVLLIGAYSARSVHPEMFFHL